VEIEYAAMNMRTEIRGQINRLQRQRLEFLLDRELWLGLDDAEVKELAYLKYLNGTGPAAPPVKIKDGGTSGGSAGTGERQHISGRQAMLETLRMKYPRRPLSGRQAIVALWRERMDWDLSPRQRELWRMRP
jgi:hypothetical protein